MAKRDILNHENVKVGELELPDDTSEAVWTEKLAKFKQVSEKPKLPNVTPRQIRQALVLSGVSMAQIEQAIQSMPEPTKSLAQIEWEYSTAFIRSNPLVAQVGQMLGWSEQQLDNLWLLAGSL